MSPERPVLWLLLIVGLIASLYVAVRRDGVEQANTSVELGVGYPEARRLALIAGAKVEDVLRRLQEAGATTLIVYEDTLTSLRETGAGHLLPVRRQPEAGPELGVQFADQVVGSRILRNIAGRLQVPMPWEPVIPLHWIPVPEALADMPEFGLGLDEQALARAADAKLGVAARPSVVGAPTRDGIQFLAKEMKDAGASVVIFAGHTIAGYPSQSRETAEALNEAELLYGSVEFGKQLGDLGLSGALDGRMLRVHAITELEMTTMSPPVAVERFVRAVRERDVRFCYVRLFLDSRPDVLNTNLKYVQTLADQLQSVGFKLGPAEPFRCLTPPRWALLAACVGVVAGALLLLGSLGRLRPAAWLALAALGILVAFAGVWVAPSASRKLFALTAALAFPTLAIVRLHPLQPRQATAFGGVIGRALGAYLTCAGVSLCGACLIVGLLSDRLFMVKVDQFMGVKLALHLPLLAVSVVYLGGLFATEPSWREQWRRAVGNWRAALATAVPYGHVLIVFLLLAGAAVMLLRSGNEPGFGLSQAEMSFRSALERILVVRPRQKEFLVGHPLLLLTIALMLLRTKRGIWLLLACAAIGQTSLVNTFCHIHTPLRISLLRTVNGLWVGAIIGIALIAIYWLVWRPLRREDAESAEPSESPPAGKRRRRPRRAHDNERP